MGALGTQPGSTRRRGFTLLELILVVVIVGILAATSIPNLRKWAHRSKRAEAHAGLGGIYKSQHAFFSLNNAFADTYDELGFQLEGGVQVDPQTIIGRYYTFTLTALEEDGNPRANFRAMAVGDIDPGDPILDVLLVENDLTVLGP